MSQHNRSCWTSRAGQRACADLFVACEYCACVQDALAFLAPVRHSPISHLLDTPLTALEGAGLSGQLGHAGVDGKVQCQHYEFPKKNFSQRWRWRPTSQHKNRVTFLHKRRSISCMLLTSLTWSVLENRCGSVCLLLVMAFA